MNLSVWQKKENVSERKLKLIKANPVTSTVIIPAQSSDRMVAVEKKSTKI